MNATPHDAESVAQMNVRIDASRLRLAKRLAAKDGKTLSQFVDELIAAEVVRQQAEFQAQMDAWQEQARRDAETFAHDLASTIRFAGGR